MNSLGEGCSGTVACLAVVWLEVWSWPERSNRSLPRPAAASEGPHPPHTHTAPPISSIREVILVHFQIQQTSKKWSLPLVPKLVSSGLLSCIENLKIILSYIEHLCLVSLAPSVSKRRPPQWWRALDLSTPLFLSKRSRIPAFEELEFSIWNVLSAVILTPYSP